MSFPQYKNLFGIESLFGADESDFTGENVDHKKVIDKLFHNRNSVFQFYYQDFIGFDNYQIRDQDGTIRDLEVYAKLNKTYQVNYQNRTQGSVEVRYENSILQVEQGTYGTQFCIYIPFSGQQYVQPKGARSFAIKIYSTDLPDFLTFINGVFPYKYQTAFNILFGKVEERLDRAGDSVKFITQWYARTPALNITFALDQDRRINHLVAILKKSIINEGWFWTGNEEKAIFNLLQSFAKSFNTTDTGENPAQSKSGSATYLLDQLVGKSIKGKTLFQIIYQSINDFFGEDYFSLVMKLLNGLWLSSAYSNPFDKLYDNYPNAPNPLPYDSHMALGFYFSNFRFKLEGVTIHAYEQKSRPVSITTGTGTWDRVEHYEEHFEYYIYQPIELVNISHESELTLYCIMPAFYLMSVEDKNRWANIETAIFLGIDAAITLTGVGNIYRLTYLRHISKADKVIIATISSVEILGGAASAVLNLMDATKMENPDQFRKLQMLALIISLSSVGAEMIARAKKVGQEVLAELPAIAKAEGRAADVAEAAGKEVKMIDDAPKPVRKVEKAKTTEAVEDAGKTKKPAEESSTPEKIEEDVDKVEDLVKKLAGKTDEVVEAMDKATRELVKRYRKIVKDVLSDPPRIKLVGIIMEGNFGEILTELHFLDGVWEIDGKLGRFKKLSKREITDLRKTNQGIDHVFEFTNPPPKYFIVESKYGTSPLKRLTDGSMQMSSDWIEQSNRIFESVDDPLKIAEILNDYPGYTSILSRIKRDNTINIKEVDEFGKEVAHKFEMYAR